MKRVCAVMVASALLFAGFPAAAFAAPQQPAGQVAGTVVDEARTPVSGHPVRIRNNATGQVLGNLTTGSDGAFLFPNLPPGAYVVEAVDAEGNVPAVSAAVTVTSGQPSVSGVMLTLAGDQAGAAAVAGGGSFFTSTKGLVIMAAAVAAGGAGIVALKNDKKPKSKNKDKD